MHTSTTTYPNPNHANCLTRAGKTPFCKSNKESSYEIYIRILKTRISFPRSFDAASRDLIQNLCHAEVDKRLCTPEGIRAHAYFEVGQNTPSFVRSFVRSSFTNSCTPNS